MLSTSYDPNYGTMPQERIYLRELAEEIDRRPDTIRRWDRLKILPKELRSHRENNGRKWRYWTREQTDQIKEWMEETDRRPGKGLSTYNPDEAQVKRHLESLRGPRQ